jgi:hypothetical protein
LSVGRPTLNSFRPRPLTFPQPCYPPRPT